MAKPYDQIPDRRAIVLAHADWHAGVIGIVCSRLVDRFHRPTILMQLKDGHAHGSGRSIRAFHLLNALESCGDLFTRYGGHSHAVGFSLPTARVPPLITALPF